MQTRAQKRGRMCVLGWGTIREERSHSPEPQRRLVGRSGPPGSITLQRPGETFSRAPDPLPAKE